MASELSMPALKSAANQHSDVVHELHDAASARGGRRENAKMTGGRDHSATSAMRGEDGLALRDNETRRDVWHGWSIGTDHGPFTLSDTGCVGPSALSGACSGQPQLASASGAPGRVRPQTPRAAPHQRPPRTTLRAMFRPEPSPKHLRLRNLRFGTPQKGALVVPQGGGAALTMDRADGRRRPDGTGGGLRSGLLDLRLGLLRHGQHVHDGSAEEHRR